MHITSSNRSEFWFHVADQSEIPIAGEVERQFDLDSLHIFINDPEPNFTTKLTNSLKHNIDLFDVVRTLVGVSDKRAYLELSLRFGRFYTSDARDTLSGDSIFDLSRHATKFFKNKCQGNSQESQLSLSVLCAYLIEKELQSVVDALKGLNKETLLKLVEHLIFPKEIQQKEAKRRGHGAEQALAKIIHQLGVSCTPDDRHSDPMKSKDPNICRDRFQLMKKKNGVTWSFDLILNDQQDNPKCLIQSLIHTSDPGQYGVNKSNETIQVKQDIAQFNQTSARGIELWGIVDGFGFSENKKDTIDKMLDCFDCFIQMNTLYKAGLRLHQLGLCHIDAIQFEQPFYTDEDIQRLATKYKPADIELLDQEPAIGQFSQRIVAGRAILYIK